MDDGWMGDGWMDGWMDGSAEPGWLPVECMAGQLTDFSDRFF